MHVEGKSAVYDINNKKRNFKNVLITLNFNCENNAKEFENNFSSQIFSFTSSQFFFSIFSNLLINQTFV